MWRLRGDGDPKRESCVFNAPRSGCLPTTAACITEVEAGNTVAAAAGSGAVAVAVTDATNGVRSIEGTAGLTKTLEEIQPFLGFATVVVFVSAVARCLLSRHAGPLGTKRRTHTLQNTFYPVSLSNLTTSTSSGGGGGGGEEREREVERGEGGGGKERGGEGKKERGGGRERVE